MDKLDNPCFGSLLFSSMFKAYKLMITHPRAHLNQSQVNSLLVFAEYGVFPRVRTRARVKGHLWIFTAFYSSIVVGGIGNVFLRLASGGLQRRRCGRPGSISV